MTAPVTRGRCPGCQSVLRIPAEWLRQTLRCKRCGATLQAIPKTPSSAATPATATAANGRGLAAATPDPFGTITPPSGPTRGNELAVNLLTANPASAIARHLNGPPPRKINWPSIVAVVLLVVLAGAGGFFHEDVLDFLQRRQMLPSAADIGTGNVTDNRSGMEPAKDPSAAANPVKPPGDLPQPTGAFPRRLLAIGVNQYLYANAEIDAEHPEGPGLSAQRHRPRQRGPAPAQAGHRTSRRALPGHQSAAGSRHPPLRRPRR